MQRRQLKVARIAERLGAPGGFLGLLLLSACLGGCGSTQRSGGTDQVKPTDSQSAPAVVPVPNDVSYTIIKTDVMPGIKRGLDIRLNRKVSEEVLRTIATELKNSDQHTYERTLIAYYLPGMEVGSGAWAISHFDPDLQIRILGASLDQEKTLLAKSTNRPAGQDVIGRWQDDFPGEVITIYREDGQLFIERNFKDGSSSKQKALEKASPIGRRFEAKERSDDGHYCVIDKTGDLQQRDKQGLVATAKKID